jgi:hypothetical protein
MINVGLMILLDKQVVGLMILNLDMNPKSDTPFLYEENIARGRGRGYLF